MDNNSTREVDVKATLLADNDNNPVWKVGDQIVTGIGRDRIIFPDLPANLYSKPTLIWLLTNRQAGAQTVEASYLTDDMNWNADYVLNVSPNGENRRPNGWVTVVNNNSGAEFRNAQLQLVAGAVNVRAAATRVQGRSEACRAEAVPAPAPVRSRRTSPSITFTPSSAAQHCRTTNRSRSACWKRPVPRSKNTMR